jgi:hypothetical protein
MSHTHVPQHEPTELVAGMSWQWDRVDAEHPAADGWVLRYVFRGATDLEVQAAPAGNVWQVRIDAAQTLLEPDDYQLFGYFERTSPALERHDAYKGRVLVLRSPLAPQNALSKVREELAIIERALMGQLTPSIESYSIDGVAVNKIPVKQLEEMRGRRWRRLADARRPGRLGRTVRVHFGAA